MFRKALLAAVATAASVAAAASALPLSASAAVPAAALGNPVKDITPSVAFTHYCLRLPSQSACDGAALFMIDLARRSEGLPALQLPADFHQLSPAHQLLAVTNAERTSRGLPAFVETTPLDHRANDGAVHRSDPPAFGLLHYKAVWAGGYATPLAVDYVWMYDDGPGSANMGCTIFYWAGCWQHRQAILARFHGAAGVGAVDADTHAASFAEIFDATSN